jgi:L(+)-tartrate dehydratase beta subunit
MKKVLTTPLRDEDLADLKIGDVVYLTGRLVTCRDVAHRRLIEQGRQLPVNLEGGAIFHAGPIVRKRMMAVLKWSPLGPPPVCVWKNLNANLSNKLG